MKPASLKRDAIWTAADTLVSAGLFVVDLLAIAPLVVVWLAVFRFLPLDPVAAAFAATLAGSLAGSLAYVAMLAVARRMAGTLWPGFAR